VGVVAPARPAASLRSVEEHFHHGMLWIEHGRTMYWGGQLDRKVRAAREHPRASHAGSARQPRLPQSLTARSTGGNSPVSRLRPEPWTRAARATRVGRGPDREGPSRTRRPPGRACGRRPSNRLDARPPGNACNSGDSSGWIRTTGLTIMSRAPPYKGRGQAGTAGREIPARRPFRRTSWSPGGFARIQAGGPGPWRDAPG
jgi:hypothetical protein